ncbi:hypothetical protein QQ045_014973 [Rhodiola kirilowii]
MWLKHKEYGEKIRDVWEKCSSRNASLRSCLSESAKELGIWGRKCFGNVNNKENIQQLAITREVVEEEKSISREIDDWLYKEELYWKQRSRVDWLKEGDRNTRYFHLRASQRRRINSIRGIQGSGGIMITDKEAIGNVIVKYFKTEIFKTDRGSSRSNIQQEVSFITQCISEDMVGRLNEPFSELESWILLKDKVTHSVLQMLNKKRVEEGMNKTLITLIPKCRNPTKIEEYRPISLCNVILDMTKAYDRVEWDFLEVMHNRMGFLDGWTEMKLRQGQGANELRGIKICRDAPEVTHFLFADDSIIFLRASTTDATNLKKILTLYEDISGQRRLVGMINKYLWNYKGGGRCIYWGSHKLLSKANEVGGLGMRDFECFNDALLARQVWRFLSNQEALETNVIHGQLGYMPSFAWRSIWIAKNKVWKGTDSDEFSVRSTYALLKRVSEQSYINRKGEPASVEGIQAFWRRIWRLKIQPKVKMFAWRLSWLKGCVMWTWSASDPGDWLLYSASKYSDNELSVILNGARQIWYNRNLVVKGGEALNPFIAAVTVKERAQQSLKPENMFVVTSLVGTGSWNPPEIGYLKINVDGAWDWETQKAGVGMCCRDIGGVFLFVKAEPILSLGSSFEAETCSLLRSLEVAEERNLKKVIFELDCAEVFTAIHGRPRLVGRGVDWISRCKCLLGRNSHWFLSLILREANSVADKLAKRAKEGEWRWRNLNAIPFGVF